MGSLVDSSIFIFHSNNVVIFLLVYIDDILVTGNNKASISSLIYALQQEFPLKDLGELTFFLGIEVARTPTQLHLQQTKYITNLLHKNGMVGAKPYSAPCVPGSQLSSSAGDPLLDPSIYRQVVGALQYCTLTRPDIAYSVNQLCQHLHSPTTLHWIVVKRVLRYLKGTPNHGLHFSKGPHCLAAFCDADWVGNPDDCRSTTGFGVLFGLCLISWCAKKQPIVSRFSTEAEYRALAMLTTELYWLSMLFKELHVPLPTVPKIWCDSLGALALASNPICHAQTKHNEVDYHFIREKVLNKDISVHYLSTHDQLADIFTKGLPSSRFLFFCDKLMVFGSPISLRGAISKYTMIPAHGPDPQHQSRDPTIVV